MAISGFLFDCDGTIFPKVEQSHRAASINAIKTFYLQQNLQFDGQAANKIWSDVLGGGILNFLQTYINRTENFPTNIMTAEELEYDYERSFLDLVRRVNTGEANDTEKDFFAVRKGFLPTIQNAYQTSVPVGVISNASQRILEATGSTVPEINQIAGLILGSDTVVAAGGQMKPAPDPFKQGGEHFGIDLADAVGYEDSGSGLLSLHHAGVGHIVFCDNKDGNAEEFAKITQGVCVECTVEAEDDLLSIPCVSECFCQGMDESAAYQPTGFGEPINGYS